ncbi:hypothetical protein LI328DRAFT_167761 [Trichoderma asperelloides]|nr:hypothetical protein LI328DRAFT_167761 [Trichoderma asperelloides]
MLSWCSAFDRGGCRFHLNPWIIAQSSFLSLVPIPTPTRLHSSSIPFCRLRYFSLKNDKIKRHIQYVDSISYNKNKENKVARAWIAANQSNQSRRAADLICSQVASAYQKIGLLGKHWFCGKGADMGSMLYQKQMQAKWQDSCRCIAYQERRWRCRDLVGSRMPACLRATG